MCRQDMYHRCAEFWDKINQYECEKKKEKKREKTSKMCYFD